MGLASGWTHFYEEEEVRVLAFGGSPVTLLDVVLDDVDTLCSLSATMARRTTMTMSSPFLLADCLDVDRGCC